MFNDAELRHLRRRVELATEALSWATNRLALCSSQRTAAERRKDVPMQVQAAYPIVVTSKLAECRDFYIRRLGFQVEFERSKKAGVSITYPLMDEPWGQRRFGLFDPAGMWVDVVEQIEPAPGFWDRYMRPK